MAQSQTIETGTIVRETPNYRCTQGKRGIRIATKVRGVSPKAMTVSKPTWNLLRNMDDREFDGSCVLELGIGAFTTR